MSLSIIPSVCGECLSMKFLISINFVDTKSSFPSRPLRQFHSANLYPSRLMLPKRAWQSALDRIGPADEHGRRGDRLGELGHGGLVGAGYTLYWVSIILLPWHDLAIIFRIVYY